ncbi:MAG: hypothetical protein OXM87_13190 [Truepera sp.]|nr:hypothetical protein [Truepera sp.]
MRGYVVGDVIPLLVNRLWTLVSCLDALLDRGCWITLRAAEAGTGYDGGNALDLIHQVVT